MTELNMKCPACGFGRIESDRICLMCGIDFQIYESSMEKQPDKSADTISDKKKERLPQIKTLPGAVCPSCGFDRIEKDKFCLMCGTDFHVYESPITQESEKEALNEKADNKAEFADFSSFDSSGDGFDRFVMEFEEAEDVVGFCRNCNANRYFGDYECRICGAVFSKLESPKPEFEHEIIGTSGIADYLKDFFKLIARIVGFFASVAKNLFSFILRVIPDVFASLKSLTVTLSSSVQTFKKQILLFLAVFIGVVALYYCVNSAIDYYLTHRDEKKRIATELAMEEEAGRFRDNAWSVKEHILLVADTDGLESAMSELKRYDIPNLRYNPFMIQLKNSLDEKALNQKIQDMSYDNYEARFEAYERLYEIAPENESYKDLLRLNRVMFASTMTDKADSILRDYNKDKALLENAISIAEKAYRLEPSSGNERLVYKAKSERLLFYEGNENVVMALRDDGFSGKKNRNQRKIRVWLKNIGPEAFRINLDFFFLVCDDGVKYQYNDFSKNLVTELGPGAEVEGDVFFYTKSRPRRIIFDHVKLGQIFRDFP